MAKTVKILAIMAICWLFATTLTAQIKPTAAREVEAAAARRKEMRTGSLLRDWPAVCIGPTKMGGRIVDLEIDPSREGVWYVAYASGGLFRTTTHGQSFQPLFDEQMCLGMGDIALAPSDPNVIWVGTGENNSSRSSYAGAGVFRSTDGGATWSHAGLTGTQHIGRIIVHPTKPEMAWVAAMGPLYSASEERGVFTTTDGGKSWKKNLYLNDTTGVIDLIIDPGNPDRLWASTWTRTRRAWEFNESGPGSMVWKSEDAGRTWTQSADGLPVGADMGRVGLAVADADPNILYAVVDNQAGDGKPPHEDTIAGLTVRMFRNMTVETLMDLEDERLDSFLQGAGYPKQYTSDRVKTDVRDGKYKPADIGNYFGDANDALFRTSIKGAEMYRSANGGKTWTLVNSEPLKGVFYTYGYYFGQVRVSPGNANEIYSYGVPLIRSTDGGSTWSRMDTTDMHVDHHDLWIDPRNNNHLLLGNDGGLYHTYDKGVTWTHLDNLPVGQFYTVQVDMESPFNVYGGLQDNGVWKGTSAADWKHNDTWVSIMGGDGMYVVPDTVKGSYVYTGFQFGNYFRIEEESNKTKSITPDHDIGTPPYRFNWRTPVVVSPHNHEVIYMGSQYVMRSLSQGRRWEEISPDLTTNRQPQGNVPFSTITALAESPLKFGLLWAGTDDGNLHVTTDGGNAWAKVSGSFPAGLWVSSVHPSLHDKNTAFVSLNGYRKDYFKTFVYKTTDLGKTWKPVSGNLPEESVNVILQDPVNPGLLYVGTDHGLYLSLDGGQQWQAVTSVPNVAVYDMVVHPIESRLVVATHGRSIWLADVKPFQSMMDESLKLYVFHPTPAAIKWDKDWGKAEYPFDPIAEKEITLRYFTRESAAASITVKDKEGATVFEATGKAGTGYLEYKWNLKSSSGAYLGKGKYSVTVTCGSSTAGTNFELE